jgi:hypothetical protein
MVVDFLISSVCTSSPATPDPIRPIIYLFISFSRSYVKPGNVHSD